MRVIHPCSHAIKHMTATHSSQATRGGLPPLATPPCPPTPPPPACALPGAPPTAPTHLRRLPPRPHRLLQPALRLARPPPRGLELRHQPVPLLCRLLRLGLVGPGCVLGGAGGCTMRTGDAYWQCVLATRTGSALPARGSTPLPYRHSPSTSPPCCSACFAACSGPSCGPLASEPPARTHTCQPMHRPVVHPHTPYQKPCQSSHTLQP